MDAPAFPDGAQAPDAAAPEAGSPDAAPDLTPPMFGGVETAVADTAYSLRLGWTEATDDRTMSYYIEYRAFVARSSGAEDFARPSSISWGTAGGVVGALAPDTDYYVVVRAVDRAGNMDGNSVERMVHTPVAPRTITLSGDIAPILSAKCTDAGCHQPDGFAEGMDFSTAAMAYQALVGVRADARSQLDRVAAGDSGQSFLVRKVMNLLSFVGDGDPMPPPAMGYTLLPDSDVALIREWIDQGAHDN